MTEIESLAFDLIDTLEAEGKAREDYFDECTYTPLKNACEKKDQIIKRLKKLRQSI